MDAFLAAVLAAGGEINQPGHPRSWQVGSATIDTTNKLGSRNSLRINADKNTDASLTTYCTVILPYSGLSIHSVIIRQMFFIPSDFNLVGLNGNSASIAAPYAYKEDDTAIVAAAYYPAYTTPEWYDSGEFPYAFSNMKGSFKSMIMHITAGDPTTETMYIDGVKVFDDTGVNSAGQNLESVVGTALNNMAADATRYVSWGLVDVCNGDEGSVSDYYSGITE
jgi:hypothetical protein